MTPDVAIAETRAFFEYFGLHVWSVEVVESIPGRPSASGAAAMTCKRIFLASRCLDDDQFARRLIWHEIGHALTPNDSNHGEDWKNAVWEASMVF